MDELERLRWELHGLDCELELAAQNVRIDRSKPRHDQIRQLWERLRDAERNR